MLSIVPTPIGNLDDITHRAISTLSAADLILAEDTRVTRKLLQKYNIHTPMHTFHAHNEHAVLSRIMEMLTAGKQLALVSDAGTPGISDPGYLLVRACIESEIPVTCLPGPVALIPAVVLSGLPGDSFYFGGFLPHKKGRKKHWEKLSAMSDTLVLYESPYRLVKCLREAIEHLGGNRRIAVCRELSKRHEEIHRGTVSDVLSFFSTHPEKVKGEIVIVIDRAGT